MQFVNKISYSKKEGTPFVEKNMLIRKFASQTFNTSIEQALICFNGNWEIPTFQREFVWNDNQVSLLIQSLYLGYPVASIVLVPKTQQRFNGVFGKNYIIDGLQRLTACNKFFNQNFRLTDVCIPELQGKTNQDLQIYPDSLNIGIVCMCDAMTEQEAKKFFIIINQSSVKVSDEHLVKISQ